MVVVEIQPQVVEQAPFTIIPVVQVQLVGLTLLNPVLQVEQDVDKVQVAQPGTYVSQETQATTPASRNPLLQEQYPDDGIAKRLPV